MRRVTFLVSVIAVLLLGVLAVGRPLGAAAQEATPAASPGAEGPPEILVEAIIPAESIPPVPAPLRSTTGAALAVTLKVKVLAEGSVSMPKLLVPPSSRTWKLKVA